MTEPITVPASAAGDLTGQALRYGIVAAAAAGASWFFHDALVTGAVIAFAGSAAAAVPAIGAYVWGAWTTLTAHHRARIMADKLPDSVARVQ